MWQCQQGICCIPQGISTPEANVGNAPASLGEGGVCSWHKSALIPFEGVAAGKGFGEKSCCQTWPFPSPHPPLPTFFPITSPILCFPNVGVLGNRFLDCTSLLSEPPSNAPHHFPRFQTNSACRLPYAKHSCLVTDKRSLLCRAAALSFFELILPSLPAQLGQSLNSFWEMLSAQWLNPLHRFLSFGLDLPFGREA